MVAASDWRMHKRCRLGPKDCIIIQCIDLQSPFPKINPYSKLKLLLLSSGILYPPLHSFKNL